MNAIEVYDEVRKIAVREGMREDAEPVSVVHFVADGVNKKENFRLLYQREKERHNALRKVVDGYDPWTVCGSYEEGCYQDCNDCSCAPFVELKQKSKRS